jgi:hypothetical protein
MTSDPAQTLPPGCNIDAHGRLMRGIMGGVMCAIALALAVVAFFTESRLLWFAMAGALAAGLFGLYEAKAGWCAARAMGFKTKF